MLFESIFSHISGSFSPFYSLNWPSYHKTHQSQDYRIPRYSLLYAAGCMLYAKPMHTLAINGFGRIGRLATRVWYQFHRDEVILGAINTSGSLDLAGWAHLLKYDTTYGMFSGTLSLEVHQPLQSISDADPLLGYLIFDGKYKVPVFAQRNPGKIPWGQSGVSTILECTGAFLTQEKAAQHLSAGAKAVLISAPAKDDSILTIVKGVNQTGQGTIFSNASGTTNCIAPVVTILKEAFGVQKAMLNTIHAYTDDQRLQDGSHTDLRRARAAGANIIPTTTGAAKTAGKVIPGMEGVFDGLAIRVPVLTGSLADITALISRQVTQDEINQAFIQASATPRWEGIVTTTTEPLVSSDIIGRPESAIVDLALTQVVGGNLVKIIAWYDNEWGFSNRLVEVAIKLASQI
jgi:glyceraldehyde 3-phosphate dehydrogenase